MTRAGLPDYVTFEDGSVELEVADVPARLGASTGDEALKANNHLTGRPERKVRGTIDVRIKGTPGPERRRHMTSQLICELQPSLDIRGLRSEPWSRRLPDGSLVEISSTPCHFGGRRWWLHCPRCRRRCTVLYGPSCRLCRNAVHEATILSPEDRLREKALKIRRRLGQREGGLLAPFPPRPKHMRWTTYERLWLKCHDIEQAVLRAMAEAIGLTLPAEDPRELLIPTETCDEEP